MRDRVPIATVLPGSSDLKTGVSENGPNPLVRELVTVLGVNRFASHEMTDTEIPKFHESTVGIHAIFHS